MKIHTVRSTTFFAVLTWFGLAATVHSRPRANPPAPSGAGPGRGVTDRASASLPPESAATLARWLLLQNGGQDAPVIPLVQVLQAAAGKAALPVDRSNPTDAAVINRLGGLLDGVLPSMNKPESAAHEARDTEQLTAAFEQALSGKLGECPDFVVAPNPETAPPRRTGSYPVFRCTDKASGKSYYLGVTLSPAGARDSVAPALRIEPESVAHVFTTDGACLLVAIESNGKLGKDAAFLNWELLDLTKLPVRAAITFTAAQDVVHAPDALLNDGRKGRD